MKPLREIVTWLIWFVFVIIILVFSYNKSMEPLIVTFEVDIHQPKSWENDLTLIGDGETVIYTRSYENSHAIYVENGELVTTGTPADFIPGESKQPFESHFATLSNTRYTREGYVNLYTLEPTTLIFEQERLGYPLINILSIIILIFSVTIFIAYLRES